VLASLIGMTLYKTGAFTVREAGAQTLSPNASVPAPASMRGPDYVSPYSLSFTFDSSLLNAGFDRAPWNDPAAESAQPVAAWEAAHARMPSGTWPLGAGWGPPAAQYPAPTLPPMPPGREAAYQRERVIAVAARHIGLAYQHHHIPAWAPPPDWRWIKVKAGQNGPGVDCSNFLSFVFNYAVGIKLPTAIGLQGRTLTLTGPGGAGCLQAERIALPDYATLGSTLEPGDVIYIHNRSGAIGHAVMWLGAIGRSPDSDPLVIDCTQTGHRDAKGVEIPLGVRLRPFRRDGWYWRQASHAHRIIRAGAPNCLTPPGPFSEGGDTA
jgi:hypothetical protein